VGGVVRLVKGYYGSPRWSGEIVDCGLPVTFDQYSACGYKCVYCFSQFQRNTGGVRALRYRAGQYKAVNAAAVKRLFRGEYEVPCSPGEAVYRSGPWQFGRFIKERRAIQWGGLSDPFCPLERANGVGLDLLRFFRSIRYPVSLSTKGVWFTEDGRYLSAIGGADHFHFKISIMTLDEMKSSMIERGVPSPKARLLAIERLASSLTGEAGVTLRLRPFIIGVSNPGYAQLIRDASNAGVKSVSVEFLCVDRRCVDKRVFSAISRETGFDLLSFYRRYSYGAGYLRLNRTIKRSYVLHMRRICRELGLRFYVSDAHFKELSDGGCCCGLPESWDYSRGQLCEALQIARREGIVRWGDMDRHLGYARLINCAGVGGYPTGSPEKQARFVGRTIVDYLRWVWNSPERRQSPYRFYDGVLYPVGADEHGDLVYEWRGDTCDQE
jgi:DNA repair photolyase